MAIGGVSAGTVTAQAQDTELPEVVVSDQTDNNLRLKKYEINRVSVLKPKDIRRKQAQTFAQGLANERGVDTQTACAFCGAKRVTINGMKGEHTTILIDGLPLHSTVSSFYGVEAIPLGGIDSIDIYRGTGAALSAPESIGGAINVNTAEILTHSAEGSVSYANDGQRNYSVLGTSKLSEKTGVLLGLQHGEVLPIDTDGNLVSEIPRQTTHTVTSKLSHRFSESTDLSFRFSYGRLRTIGGSMNDIEIAAPPAVLATSSDFINKDVRNRFIGESSKITEIVALDRYEAASIFRLQVDSDSRIKFGLGGASQFQRSIYSHGYDYDNDDKLWVGVLQYERTIGGNHLLTFGVDSKSQHMNSSSEQLYVNKTPPLKQDDLRYQSLGVFAQDTWLINESNELAFVLRSDSIQTHWTDLGNRINEVVLAPRVMYKLIHSPVLTSRVSGGIGYRSPLTLFESQHGTAHDGFIVDVQKLETAQSFVYSLAGQWQDDFFEFGTHLTRIQNMAYGLDRADQELPTLFRNSSEPYTISVFDLSYGRRIFPNWTVEGLIEVFNYPSGYKEKLPVAAVEQRMSITSNLSWGRWTSTQRMTLIGSRDLSAYGYDKHYNVVSVGDDIMDTETFGKVIKSNQKFQRAPQFFTLDLTLERSVGENLFVGVSLLNALDYTQTFAGDSPTTWHIHGNHYHLDNFHIWGPNRGRQIFVNLRGEI